MVYLISRTVPEDLQPAVVVLAFAELPVVRAEIMGRPEEEVIDILAGFFMTRDDLLELSGLSGGCTTETRQLWARSQAEQAWAAYKFLLP